MTTLTSEITEISLKSITEEEEEQQKEEQIKLLDLYSKKNKRKIEPIPIYKQWQEQIDIQKLTVIHDTKLYMFRVQLANKKHDVALCYLPTRVKKVVEFYHIEIPLCYRNKGLGDVLVQAALNWARDTNTRVIPSCSFVQEYLLRFNSNNKRWKDVIVNSEEEGMELIKRKETSFC